MLCGFATAMFTTTIFLYFCAQNTHEISPRTAAILASIMCALAVASYVPALIIFRRAFTAMVFCVMCWLGFYLTPLVFNFFLQYWPLHYGRAISFTTIIFVMAFLAAMLARKAQNTMRAILLFLGVLVVVFAMNFEKLLETVSNANSAANNNVPLKRDFVVDSSAKSPNVFWIHPDGMLGVSSVKKYFGEDQKEFLAALHERGFEINEAANFEARHSTGIAIPVLLNPYAYDMWLRDEIFSAKETLNGYELSFLSENGEFPNAFALRDYDINVVGYFYSYYPIKNSRMWMSGVRKILSYEEINNDWKMGALSFNNPYIIKAIEFLIRKFAGEEYRAKIPEERLKEIFMNGWDASNRYLDVASGLYDTLHGFVAPTRKPNLTFIHYFTPHYPFVHAEDGTIIHSPQNKNPLDYYSQHVWSARILLGLIDIILEKDPDAVIVVQADHGVHANTEDELKKYFGSDVNPLEIWNSTMSALRVPAEYKTGDEHYALETPLNMTRYLVNSFVGKNYEYLKQ